MTKESRSVTELLKLINKDKKNGKFMHKDELEKVLRKLSAVYYGSGDSLVDDDIFDYLKDLLSKKDPDNSFLSEVTFLSVKPQGLIMLK